MVKIPVDKGQSFDFGKTSEEYAKFRDIYPKALYDRLYELGVGKSRTQWLDLGTGTGVLPRAMAHFGANIIGVDLSENQITQAKRLSAEFKNISYKVCGAEGIDFAKNSFDAITACQCFWYFDPSVIVPKIKGMLRDGGIFVKIYMEFLEYDPIAGKSAELVRKLNPKWNSGTVALADLKKHYFDNPHEEILYADIPFTRESWHGRMNSCRGVLASMDEKTFAQFENEHKKMLIDFPKEFTIRHRIYLTYYYL